MDLILGILIQVVIAVLGRLKGIETDTGMDKEEEWITFLDDSDN